MIDFMTKSFRSLGSFLQQINLVLLYLLNKCSGISVHQEMCFLKRCFAPEVMDFFPQIDVCHCFS